MNTWTRDLRYACRTLGRNPLFTATAVLSLAIGVGANTAVFSITRALLLRPLPYGQPERLVILWNRSPGLNITRDWFSTAQYFDIRNSQHAFEQLALAIGGNYNLTGRGEPERVGVIRVSSSLLPMLGVRAERGRLFEAADDSVGAPPAALLTYAAWVRRFGRDPRAVGATLTLNGSPYQVAGILPRGFSLPQEVLPTLDGAEQPEIFLPLPLSAGASQVRTHEDYNVLGRLKPGVSLSQAQAAMDTLTARLRCDHPDAYPPNGGLTFSIVPLQEQVVGDVRGTLYILSAAVGLVLLIACANVASLLLSRAVARQKEIAVRRAVGATRARIVRQLLTESLVLALAGGAVGALLAQGGVRWIQLLAPEGVPRLGEAAVNVPVLAFNLLVSFLAAVVFGLAPALRVSKLDIDSTLKGASRGSAGAGAVWGRGRNTRRLLVISELALSVVLLAGAGLLVRSFARLERVAPGFNPSHVFTFELTLSGPRYTDRQVVLGTYRQLWERLEALPGVSAAGGVTELPLSGALAWTPITVEGRVPAAGEKFINADIHVVGGHYFQAMQIPLRRGRFFNEQDTAAQPVAVVVDERMARDLWPNQDPIGRRIHIVELKSAGPWQTVVGVAGRVKHESLDSEPRIAFYLAQTQFPARPMAVVVRSGAPAGALAAAVKAQVRSLDPGLPIYDVSTMAERVDQSLARRRFSMMLLGIFAGLALALALIGIYGVLSYHVSQGTRELGVRMALGATKSDVLNLVVRQGMTLALAGVAAGLAGALALTRFMSSLLFGVRPTDALTFTAVALVLFCTGLLASYVPARRAARIDPMQALRWE